jgi:hypothetical protein
MLELALGVLLFPDGSFESRRSRQRRCSRCFFHHGDLASRGARIDCGCFGVGEALSIRRWRAMARCWQLPPLSLSRVTATAHLTRSVHRSAAIL